MILIYCHHVFHVAKPIYLGESHFETCPGSVRVSMLIAFVVGRAAACTCTVGYRLLGCFPLRHFFLGAMKSHERLGLFVGGLREQIRESHYERITGTK